MTYSNAILLKQMAALKSLRAFLNLLFISSLCVLGAISLYCAGYFIYEWAVPPPNITTGPFLFQGVHHQAPFILLKAFYWGGLTLDISSLFLFGLWLLDLKMRKEGESVNAANFISSLALLSIGALLMLISAISCGC